MANKILTVQAPMGGISRRSAYQTQPPFTSYDSLNFWPLDVKTGRVTSATRPPLKLFGSLETQVNMLAKTGGIRASHPAKSFAAAYVGTIYYWNGTTMVAASGAQAAAVDTGNYVSATTVVDQLVICDATVAPIAFDYTTGAAATIVASVGTVPVAATIATTWQGALWLVVDNILYASRVGDITDWDTSVALDDLFGSFYTDGEYKGIIAGPITAVMPQTSDVQLVSTISGTLAMRGHPRQGGVFEPIGSQYILGQGAWTQIPDGTIVMMTPMGLMTLAPSPGAVMAPLSRERIPDALIGISYDRDDPLINLEYDTRWNGVHIYIRGAQEQAWWFDMNTGGFHREEIASYPFTTVEFSDFITENVSGVLLGRYNGIYDYDRFGTETINSSLVAGPVKMSQSPMHASKIKNARVTFARDTPVDQVGTFKIAAGLDGQDAVNRLLNGEEQYSVALSSLAANNGMCYPEVAGHAAVFSFTTETGDVAVEEISVNVAQMGNLTMGRGTQIAVTGEPTTFSGAFIELDTDVWAGYSVATPVTAPDESLPDYTHFLDLSLMPQTWWDEILTPNGEDIRVSDADDNQVPAVLQGFNLASQIGMLCFRMTQQTTTKAVRVWVGNESASTPDADSTYGSENAFDSSWRAFWPDGGGTSNLTSYSDNTATSNFANNVSGDLVQYYGAETGPMGGTATDYNQGDVTYFHISGWMASQGFSGADLAWTFICCFKRTAAKVIRDQLVRVYGAGVQDQVLNADTSGANAITAFATSDIATGNAVSTAGGAHSGWRHHTGVVPDDDSRSAYTDGVTTTKVTESTADLGPTMTDLHIGDLTWHPQGHLAMVQIHTAARNDAWIEYQGAMMDQSTFWGTVGEFVLVNTVTPDTLLTSACPTGNVPQTEVGTWDGYQLLTPVDPSDGSVVKFTHLYDLSQCDGTWWTQAVARGKAGDDIRATDTNNVIIPIDVIEYNESLSTGLVAIRKTQAKGSPQAIRLWVGNATAVTLDVCNATGRYTAYDADWRGFWPSGTGTDRTQYLNVMTATGSPSTTTGGSPVSSDATVYDNASSTAMYSTATNNVPTGSPITVMASVVKPAGSIHTDSVIMSVQDSDSQSGVLMKTRPSTTPARTVTRNAFGTEAWSGYSGTIVATTAWFQAGTAYGDSTRLAYADANAGSSSSSQSTIILNSLDRIMIGAEYATTHVRGMDATISLCGVHAVARGEAWLNYWNKSLTQATFWTVGGWVADPTALT